MKGMDVNMKKKKHNTYLWMNIAPLYIFTIIFVSAPLIYMIALSFMTKAQGWGVEQKFTIANYLKIFEPVYLNTFIESLKLAVVTTLITLLVGYPYGYFMSKLSAKWKKVMMMLVVVPFWTNALIRMYGWIIIFRSNGLLDKALMGTGLTTGPLKLLYSYPAVLVGMVYSLLPFMILAIYSVSEKMDWSYVEAARDLGASRLQAFLSITLKLTVPGILSGVVLVFIPSMGLFFIADILGGGKFMLVGNLIRDQIFTTRDWPFAAALSVVLMILTSLIIALYRKVTHVKELEGLV